MYHGVSPAHRGAHMKNLLSRTSLLATLLLLPGCASLAQDPEPYRNVSYSGEELDNLVAPVALYPDALLAQILVAATFPDLFKRGSPPALPIRQAPSRT